VERGAALDVWSFVSAVLFGLAIAWCLRQSRVLRWLVP
jgi:hypothetical protein